MVTQPQFTIYVSSTMRTPPRSVHGNEYRFVTVKPTEFFGLTKLWITKQQSVMVSDKEPTILDALRQPQYAGGIPEVAKAPWISREDIKIPQLLDYVQHFSSGALRRRLGFLLELYAMASLEQLKPLRSKLTSTYDRLDTVLHYYRMRWGGALCLRAYEALQSKLNKKPKAKISVPIIFAQGGADESDLPAGSEEQADYFTGGYRRVISKGVGHFPAREDPAAVAKLLQSQL
jgi:pimeloyl-ACP methyl ester carboxylesterase